MAADPYSGILVGALGLGQSLYNTFSQQNNNEEQKKFTRQMYEQQRADNLSQWHLQNDYNSPRSQMVRLKAAGLNPNLVYGSGANQVSGPIASASPQSYSPTAPQSNIANDSIAAYQNYEMTNAQKSNLIQQNTVLANQAANTAADTAGKIINNSRSELDLDTAKQLQKISLDTAAESLRQMTQQTGINLGNYLNAVRSTDQSIKESVSRIGRMAVENATSVEKQKEIQAQVQLLLGSRELQELDFEMRKNGIQPNDPFYMRALAKILPPDLADTVKGGIKSTSDKYNELNNKLKNNQNPMPKGSIFNR